MFRSQKLCLLMLSLSATLSIEALGQVNELENKILEVQWAPTEFQPRALDNSITEKYCGYSSKRFLGCVAGVEKFGQFIEPHREIQIQNSEFIFVTNEKLKSLNARELNQHRRAQFNSFEKQLNDKTLKSLIDVYTDLRKQNQNPKPFQTAVSLNELLAVIYDPHHMYQPMFAHDGLNFIRQQPHMGVAFKKVGNRVGIQQVYMNTSAEIAGIKPGDVITHVDGNDLQIQSEEDLDKVLVFNPEQKVQLRLLRKNRPFEVQVVFSYANLAKVVDREITFQGKKYSYLNMREVPSDLDSEATCRVFSKILKKFEQETEGLILDLRNNVGGPGETAACLSALFVGKNKTMYIEQDMADVTSRSVEGTQNVAFRKKMVVLVNAKTASSGELMAGALQFYSRGLILGDRTFGKSIGQIVESYENEKFDEYSTISKAFMPDGISYQSKGISPDFYVFRDGFTPNADEIAILREEDLALYPLKFEDRKPMVKKSKPVAFPKSCVNSEAIMNRYNSLQDTNWQKDFQLQFALGTIHCLK